jgi:hypothetical protein
VIRYPDDEVLQSPDAITDDIYHRLLPSPQPSPGVPGEGERLRSHHGTF